MHSLLFVAQLMQVKQKSDVGDREITGQCCRTRIARACVLQFSQPNSRIGDNHPSTNTRNQFVGVASLYLLARSFSSRNPETGK